MTIPTPKEVLVLLGPTEWSLKAVSEICEKLRDRNYVLNATRNSPSSPSFRFTFDGAPSHGDRDHVIRNFRNAGWETVTITTESHRNEDITTIFLAIDSNNDKLTPRN